VIRFLVTLVVVAALVWAGATIKLGKHTLFGHIRAIWHSEQAQDMKEGVRETAGPAVKRVERGIEAGYNAMKNDGSVSAGSGSAAKP
jgi:hypothetical protein